MCPTFRVVLEQVRVDPADDSAAPVSRHHAVEYEGAHADDKVVADYLTCVGAGLVSLFARGTPAGKVSPMARETAQQSVGAGQQGLTLAVAGKAIFRRSS